MRQEVLGETNLVTHEKVPLGAKRNQTRVATRNILTALGSLKDRADALVTIHLGPAGKAETHIPPVPLVLTLAHAPVPLHVPALALPHRVLVNEQILRNTLTPKPTHPTACKKNTKNSKIIYLFFLACFFPPFFVFGRSGLTSYICAAMKRVAKRKHKTAPAQLLTAEDNMQKEEGFDELYGENDEPDIEDEEGEDLQNEELLARLVTKLI